MGFCIGRSTRFSGVEQFFILVLAWLRSLGSRAQGLTDCKAGPQSGIESDTAGVAGEWMMAKLGNLFPNLNFAKPDDAIDGYFHCGVPFDAKLTDRENGRLQVVHWKKDKMPDGLYVLFVGRFPGPFRFAGCMPAPLLICEEREGRLGDDGPLSYLAEQSELMSIGDGLKWLKENKSVSLPDRDGVQGGEVVSPCVEVQDPAPGQGDGRDDGAAVQ